MRRRKASDGPEESPRIRRMPRYARVRFRDERPTVAASLWDTARGSCPPADGSDVRLVLMDVERAKIPSAFPARALRYRRACAGQECRSKPHNPPGSVPPSVLGV